MTKPCRLLALLLTLALTWAAAPALAEGPVKITVAVPDNIKVENYNTNGMTLQLEADLGMDLEFVVYPSTDYKTKLNLMIQSGDALPDVLFLTGVDANALYAWAQTGALLPLTDYYADPELAANIQKTYAEVGDFRSLITLPDGEIYQIPNYSQSIGNEQAAKLYVNETWVEKLGLTIPASTDGFLGFLRAVKAADHNGNGEADEVILAGFGGVASNWFDYLMNSFVYSDSTNHWIKVEEGAVQFAYTTEAWKSGLAYIKALFDEGLIATENLTQDFDQYKTMVNTLDIFGLCYIAPSEFTTDIKNEYVAVAPMEGPEGVRYARYNPTTPSSGMVITADCQNPEAAFRLGDLMSERTYTITNRWGQRGVDWDYFDDYVKTLDNYKEEEWSATVPGCEKLIIVYDDATFWGSGTMQNRSYLNIGPAIRGFGVAGGRAISAATVIPYTLNMADSYLLYPPYYPEEFASGLMYTAEESEVVTEILTTLKDYVKETTANWLLGNGSIDADWDAFQNELKTIGIDTALTICQASYDRAHSAQ